MSRRTNTSSAERAARIARRDMREARTPVAFGEPPAARAARVAELRARIASV
jgi:hypothetical protein